MLAALQAKLGIIDDAVFKSGSALAGGVATMGETCGALTGAIMALGTITGRERIEDVDTYQKAKVPAKELYHRFRQEVGHSICAEIHKIKYGRVYRLSVPEEAHLFHESGGHSRTGCPAVCGIGARIAADMMLTLQGK